MQHNSHKEQTLLYDAGKLTAFKVNVLLLSAEPRCERCFQSQNGRHFFTKTTEEEDS